MRNLPCTNIQVDEIWSYVGKKQAHINKGEKKYSIGDQWTFVAIDRDTKLVPNYLIGKRTGINTKKFLYSTSARMANRIQISSDALKHYVYAVDAAFGSDVDYGRIVKTYKAEPHGSGKYSPSQVIRGNPDIDFISTSHVERQNLTMRMSMRRFTRLTNAFSKKLENMKAAVSLHFAHYNFVRIHQSLRVTPAMEAGVVDELWTIHDLIKIAQRY